MLFGYGSPSRLAWLLNTLRPRFLTRACCLESGEDENRDNTLSENNVLGQNKSLMNCFILVQRACAKPLPGTRHSPQGAVQCERKGWKTMT